jgi:hypothetical protein
MKNVFKKKYQVIYSQDKAIKFIFFGDNLTSTSFLGFDTDNYQQLVNYIYDENIYLNETSRIDFDYLKMEQNDVETTLFKYDD